MKSAIRLVFALVVLNLIAGCTSSTTKLRIGMTKDEVIAVMGQPNSVAAQGKNEDLNYSVKDDSGGGYFQIDRPYYVRLVDGRVESYGMYNQITPIRTMMPPPNNSAMLRIGMTKEEALATMGKPISVSAEGDVELLNYSLPEYNGISTIPIVRPYGIRLTNGKVDAFGYTAPGMTSGVQSRMSTSGYPGNRMPGVRDAVQILSVEPASFVPGQATSYKVKVKYVLQSSEKGAVRIGFNTNGPDAYSLKSDERTAVKKGTGEVELSGTVKAVDWGENNPFQANVILEFSDADGRHRLTNVFKELDLKKPN
jgi:hypothetical protein